MTRTNNSLTPSPGFAEHSKYSAPIAFATSLPRSVVTGIHDPLVSAWSALSSFLKSFLQPKESRDLFRSEMLDARIPEIEDVFQGIWRVYREAYKESICVLITQWTQTVLRVLLSRCVPECEFNGFPFHFHINRIGMEDGGSEIL
jgi:hypothetical protein